MKRELINRISSFWKDQAHEIFWFNSPKKIFELNKLKKIYDWYPKSKTNVCFNCLDLNILNLVKGKTNLAAA